MQGGRQNTEKIPAGDTGKNMRFILTSRPKSDNILKQSVPACIKYGGIAQLGERVKQLHTPNHGDTQVNNNTPKQNNGGANSGV